MSSLVMNVFKGQRIDITAPMKDADAILEAFRKHEIKFYKKYTTINENGGPSTITFKGVRAEKEASDITDIFMELHEKARNEEIGNVYVKFITPKPRMTSTVTTNEHSETETTVAKNMPNPEDTTEEDNTL